MQVLPHTVLSFYFCLSLCFVGISQDYNPLTHKKQASTISVDSLLSMTRQADSLVAKKAYAQAEVLYKSAFQSSSVASDSIMYNIYLDYFIFLSKTLKKYDKAWELNDWVYEYFCNSGDTKGIIKSTIAFGHLSQDMSKSRQAFYYYDDALALLQDTGPEYNTLKYLTLANRAYVIEDVLETVSLDSKEQKFKLIVKDRKESLKYLSEKSPNRIWRSAYMNLGHSYSEINSDSAIYYYKKTLKYCKKLGCNLTYNNLADAYLKKKQPKKALEILNNIDLNKTAESLDGESAIIFFTLGETYIALEKYIDAIKNLKIGQKKLIEIKEWKDTVEITNLLAETLQKQGKADEAIKELKKIPVYLQNSYNERLDREATKLLSEKELEAKKKEVVDLTEEKEKIVKQKSNIVLLSYLLVALLFITIAVLIYRSVHAKIKFHQLNEKVNHNRLTTLRSAMNPHFLFNSFSTLQNFMLKKENTKAISYMIQLSGLIRNVVSSSDSIYISIKEEIEIIKSYIILEQGRFNDTFEVDYIIDKELIENNPMIPSMVIQPFIENAIIHGFQNMTDRDNQLQISFVKNTDNSVICKITDNGVGREKAMQIKNNNTKNTQHLSIATRNIDERLDILSKAEKKKARISFIDLYDDSGAPKGTEVVVLLPIVETLAYKNA